MGLARGASEVLLLRSLRNKEAKAVHIPPNRNRNPRSIAIITFENNEDLKRASSKPVRYYNYTLYWKLTEERRPESKNIRTYETKIIKRNNTKEKHQEANREYNYKAKITNTERNKNSENSKEDTLTIWERIDQHQTTLQKILEKLEKISGEQENPAQRS
jgi:hypothetical protein